MKDPITGETLPDDPTELGRHFALEHIAGALDDLLDEYRDNLHRATEDLEPKISDTDWETALSAYDALITEMHSKAFEALKGYYSD